MESIISSNELKPQFTRIDFKESLDRYKTGRIHAAHVLFWTKDRRVGTSYALMQMRSDGEIGFPGGKSDEEFVDEKEVVSALYREVYEEMDYRLTTGQITVSDHIFTHTSSDDKVLHFFVKQIPIDMFERLELTYTRAKSFPEETVGLIRVPLASTTPGETVCEPVRKFFKNFGRNQFAGNARNQLLEAIHQLKLMSAEDMAFVNRIMEEKALDF